MKRLKLLILSGACMLSFVIMNPNCIAAASQVPETVQESAPETETGTGEAVSVPVLNGWVQNCYYIDGVMQKGLVTIEGFCYYLDPATGEKTVNAARTIDGKLYYFDKTGQMKTDAGVLELNGKLYYFKKGGEGISKKGWFKGFDGKKRYSLGKGVIAAGPKKISKKLYFFNTKSGKLQKKGFVKYKGNKYYVKKNGRLARGWTAIGNAAYYFYKKSGKMARNTKIGYLKIPKSGKLGSAYARGIRVLNRRGWSLRAAFRYSYQIRYKGRWMRRGSSEAYANYGFKTGTGNCYVMAATFYIMGKLLGYNIHQMSGAITHRHSWTIIIQKGKSWVYDPNFTNETGRNGYKIWYGKPGTWRYNSIRRMN